MYKNKPAIAKKWSKKYGKKIKKSKKGKQICLKVQELMGVKKADLLKRKKIRKRNLKRKNDLFVWFRRV